MHFDDRLATVLRIRATGERAARTQFRQLIDLLGERPQAGDPALKAAAYLRLIALGEMIPPKQRAAIVGEHGWRFRNPELVKWFGEAHPHVAAAALYRAQLRGEEWAGLIPKLPIRARGFLRHRRDLPREAIEVLDRLGVSDRALPEPEPLELMDELAPPPETEAVASEPEPPGSAKDDVRSLVQRIEGFRRARQAQPPGGTDPNAPRLPMGEAEHMPDEALDHFLFGADFEGKIDSTDDALAPMLVGTDLRTLQSSAVEQALALRQPINGELVTLRGASRIEGAWILDAIPRFTRGEGRFVGYAGRFRRAVAQTADHRSAAADRLRQLLHELRTPVNAMQGYAEIIQQQMIGPVPHEYRAIAATIAGDSAHILAGFDELDRLAKLEAGALDLDSGTSDFAAVLRRQVAQLQTVLSPRVARFEASIGEEAAPLGVEEGDAEVLAWRLLATLAGAIGAGEAIPVHLTRETGQIELAATLPTSLAAAEDIFAVETRPSSGTPSAGIFGAGFSLRLARAEARSVGGDLLREGDRLILSLPLMSAVDGERQPESAAG